MNKEIAYLIQTPDYIPDYVRTLEEMGRDVYILSWEKPVEHKNSIFFPNGTCWTGRNKLAEIVPKKYLYCVFTEDDLELRIKDENTNKNPWEIFDNFLLEYKPAIGAVFFRDHDKKVKKFYDTIIMGMHKDTIDICFPVYTDFDQTSWLWATIFHLIITILAFEPYILSCDELLTINKYHREYPRKGKFRFLCKLFKNALLREEDRNTIDYIFSLVHSIFIIPRYYNKICPNGYKEMAEDFKKRVNKNHIFWKDNPFINE